MKVNNDRIRSFCKWSTNKDIINKVKSLHNIHPKIITNHIANCILNPLVAEFNSTIIYSQRINYYDEQFILKELIKQIDVSKH